MQPIGPLMIEHRLIERLLNLMAREFERIKANTEGGPASLPFVDPVFIDTAVDFLRTYADRCHHGKEEDTAVQGPGGEKLFPEHRQIMEELIQEHAWARETTASLVKAKEGYLLEKPGALNDLMESYGKADGDSTPGASTEEDRHFFIPCMGYCSEAEQADLLARMQEFDRHVDPRKIPRAWWSPSSSTGAASPAIRRRG